MMRIYTPEEYLKGLEALGVVVHATMRDTIMRLNPKGVTSGCRSDDGGLFPPPRPGEPDIYVAGYADGYGQQVNVIYDQPPEPVLMKTEIRPGYPNITVSLDRAELASFLKHLASTGASAERIAELAGLLA